MIDPYLLPTPGPTWGICSQCRAKTFRAQHPQTGLPVDVCTGCGVQRAVRPDQLRVGGRRQEYRSDVTSGVGPR